MLGDVSQQADDEVEEAIHLEAATILQIHDQVLHQVNDLGEALQVLESWTRIRLVPVNLLVARCHESCLEHAKVLVLEVVNQAAAGRVLPPLL